MRQTFTAPQLTEYGRLSEIVRGGNDGVPPPYPQGWFDGTTLIRTPECSGGDGPGKKADGPEAWWPCGSS